MIDPDKLADNWLGRKVEFTLLGQRVVGRITELITHICTGPNFLIAEFIDTTGKPVKVGAPYQAFRRLED